MDNIIEPTIDYDFSKLYLGPPTTLAGGAYFTRIMYSSNKSLFIQTPKCLTKQGFVKSGKRMYTDLMFDNNDTVFINWIENLESQCQNLIFNKGQNWFETKLEQDDIESAFTSPFKIFKSGKYYLLRVNIKQNIKTYDETDNIINIEDITPEKTIISILEIQGIKFTSRNFQIDFELKQSMVVSPDPFLDACFIKKPMKKRQDLKDVGDADVGDDKYKDVVEYVGEYVGDDKDKDNNFNDNDKDDDKDDDKDKDKDKDDDNDNDNDKDDDDNLDDFINNSAKGLMENINTLEKYDSVQIDSLNKNEGMCNNIEDVGIMFDFEDLTPENKANKEELDELKEVELTLANNLEPIILKKPNQVYIDIYQKAREKAKEAKKTAIRAHLEMKNIKKTYMLDSLDDSDSDSDSDNDMDDECLEEIEEIEKN